MLVQVTVSFQVLTCRSRPPQGTHYPIQQFYARMPLSSLVTAEKSSPLERSHGEVHLIGGDFYYSPNSQHDVQLPLVYNDIPFRDCFKDGFAEFRQPLWWQPACPYLAFVPL